ncbi:metal-dependent hydrolase [Candidatus Berkelbacteria bacterium]|nr:metal-dependent hydrolase [Candidatus Berkelbacteria bacterium]
MTDKTHQLIGLTAATSLFFVFHPTDQLTWGIAGTIAIGSFIGSVLPDIDQPTSDIWDVVPAGEWLGKLTSKSLGGHRNLSHSILGFLLFTFLFNWLVQSFLKTGTFIDSPILLESFMAGFIAHLLADSVTVMGIPLFWPFGANMGFPPRPFHGIRILTGKWFENLIVFPGVVIVLALIIITNSNNLALF